MKKGMKLKEFTPVETEYENAAAFPTKETAESYCKEMNAKSSGWTAEKMKLSGLDKWRVVWLGEHRLTPEEQAEVERLEAEAAKHEENAGLLRASMSSKPSPDDFQQEERVQRELERAKDKRALANRIGNRN